MAADDIKFKYTSDQREAILGAIPSVGGEAKDKVIADLTNAAKFSIMLARRGRAPCHDQTPRVSTPLKDVAPVRGSGCEGVHSLQNSLQPIAE